MYVSALNRTLIFHLKLDSEELSIHLMPFCHNDQNIDYNMTTS